MPILFRLGLLRIVRVSGIAEEQVGILCGLFQRSAGGCIAGKHEPQPSAGCAQHLSGCNGRPIFQSDRLSALQRSPLLHRHPQRSGSGRVKAACAGQVQPVAPAGDPVLRPEGQQFGPHRPAGGQRFQPDRVGAQRHSPDGIGLGAGQGADGAPDRLHPLGRAKDRQRPGAALTAQRLQQAGQAEDMVAVVVGQTDGVQLHQVDPGAAGSGLGALAAVEQQAVPAAFGHCRRQGAVGQGHGGRCAQQSNGQHKKSSVSFPFSVPHFAPVHNRRSGCIGWGR